MACGLIHTKTEAEPGVMCLQGKEFGMAGGAQKQEEAGTPSLSWTPEGTILPNTLNLDLWSPAL